MELERRADAEMTSYSMVTIDNVTYKLDIAFDYTIFRRRIIHCLTSAFTYYRPRMQTHSQIDSQEKYYEQITVISRYFDI